MLQRVLIAVLIVSSLMLLNSCGSAEWVHPNKPKDMFAQDYNQCESKMLNDPKLQQGNRYLLAQATERCLMKDGWMLREKR
jgi:hypothetical protein